jgi:cytidine deaminase
MSALDAELLERLRSAACDASDRAYAPYSGFRVGAACVTASGRIYTGSNVENASYGLTICAERNAVFQAVAAGDRDLRALVVYTPTRDPTPPCGACRQVMCEFGEQIVVIACCENETVLESTSGKLLPERFRL